MVDVKMQVFNVRVTPELLALVKAAVEASGLDQSEWVRDALEAGARSELSDAERRKAATARGGRLGGGFVTQTGTCVHPLTARKRTRMTVYCGVCSQVLRRTV